LIPGFIFNFRERKTKTKSYPDETFFVHINDFISWSKSSGKSGINRDDCKTIGVKIHSSRTQKYDISKFVGEAVSAFIQRGYIKSEFIKGMSEYLLTISK
ncbi:hypothetical protein M5X10_29565, partial [Paenibacillus chitinolyticus]|nr:hypothetical protein [Paenibacillus chitinolyticus]